MFINNKDFDKANNMLKSFFKGIKGFKELNRQNELCLDNYLLKQPEEKGCFCLSKSYESKNEGDINEKILFEFEINGSLDELRKIKMELLDYLGFNMAEYENIRLDLNYPICDYYKICKKYGVEELKQEHEKQIEKDFGKILFLEKFPEKSTSSDKNDGKKIDVIIHGQKTISSSESIIDKELIRENFKTIYNGKYANKLYEEFTKEKVDSELDKYLDFDLFVRSGGKISMSGIIHALKISSLL